MSYREGGTYETTGKKQRFNGMAAIGMGFGLMFGILLENLPLGLLVGAALAGFGNMTTQR